MRFILYTSFCLWFSASAYAQTAADSLKYLDYSMTSRKTQSIQADTRTYQEAIAQWKTADSVHTWIKDHFQYDFERALQLANNSTQREKVEIYTPEDFWVVKKGICVDLSRFAYETLQTIDATDYVKYLKIEFEPVEVEGRTFVNHWLVVYKENGAYYFIADSKRPALQDGPYETVEDFIVAYEAFRERKIHSYRLLDSYKRVQRTKTYKSVKNEGEVKSGNNILWFAILSVVILGVGWLFFKQPESTHDVEKVVLTGTNKLDALHLKWSDLVGVSSADNYVEVHYLENGILHKQLLRNTLKNIEQAQPNLLRVHRSHLINPAHFIAWKDATTIKLTQMDLPISKTYKPVLVALKNHP